MSKSVPTNSLGLNVETASLRPGSSFRGAVSLMNVGEDLVRLETCRTSSDVDYNGALYLSADEAMQVALNLTKLVSAIRSGEVDKLIKW